MHFDHVRLSATYSFGNAAASDTTDFASNTLTGARVGDIIYCQDPTGLDSGLSVTAVIVTAADTVTLRIMNATTGIINVTNSLVFNFVVLNRFVNTSTA